MKKIPLKEIAKKANVSLRTVARVINEEPYVSRETQRKVSSVLSKNGYPSHINGKNEHILLISRNIPSENVLKNFSGKNFPNFKWIMATDSSLNMQQAVGMADVAIIINKSEEHFLQQLKKWNPDIFRIATYASFSQNIELTIAENNSEIGRCAADYLCGTKKCRRIYCFREYGNYEFFERQEAFCGTIVMKYPDVKIIFKKNFWDESERESLLADREFRNSGIFIPGCTPAVIFLQESQKKALSPVRDYTFLSCDNPRHFCREKDLEGLFFPAYIEFHLEQTYEWLHYFLMHRPRQIITPAITYLPFKLVENNQIKKEAISKTTCCMKQKEIKTRSKQR